MILPIYHNTSINSLPGNVETIQLVRPVKQQFLAKLVQRGLKKIQLSKSTYDRIPKQTMELLRKSGIEFELGEKRGRAINIELEKMQEAIELRKDNKAYRKIQEMTGIPKSSLHYLIRYSKKSKVKVNGKPVHLK